MLQTNSVRSRCSVGSLWRPGRIAAGVGFVKTIGIL
jgi:hypothetical protein